MTTTLPVPIDTDFDEGRAEEFAGRLIETYANASTALLLSLGHRVGLFDALAGLPPSTSDGIAEAAGLQERYVREWLAGMHVAGVVDHDPEAGTWWLPTEHAASLTRSAGADNLAKLGQFIGLLAEVEHEVAQCFHEGGGVPYSAYEEFHELMAEDSWDVANAMLVDNVVPLVDGLAERLTTGIRVADIGCGSGPHLIVLASEYPTSEFVGYDFEERAITTARAEAERRGLTNLRFEIRDVTDMTGAGPFDLVTAFDAIHDQAHPGAVLAGIAEILGPDGVFLMADVKASSLPHENADLPLAPFLYTVSLMHCMTVSLALDGTGLGAAWGHQTAVRMLHDAGFADVQIREIEGDFFNSYFVARKATVDNGRS